MSRTHVLLAACVTFVAPASPRASGMHGGTRGASANVTCIAIVLPVVQGVSGSATDVAAGLRDLFASFLSGPSVKVVPLETRLASQAGEEAQQKGCEPLLVVTMTRKGGGKGLMKALGQATGNSSYYLPGGGTVASSTARIAASTGLQTASALASSTKAKDEIRLEYRLESAGGQIRFGPGTEHQTAAVDGEDLLTAVVGRAAEAIAQWRRAK